MLQKLLMFLTCVDVSVAGMLLQELLVFLICAGKVYVSQASKSKYPSHNFAIETHRNFEFPIVSDILQMCSDSIS